MPLQRCTLEDKPGWQFGEAGKCYTYDEGDEDGEVEAKKKAIAQALAMNKGKPPAEGLSRRASEQRYRPTELEMRGKPGAGAVLAGYVAVFDQPSAVLWDFRSGHFVERIDGRAFNKTIHEADVKALRNHDPNLIVGRSKAGVGNIRFLPDSTGLYHELEVPDTATARSLYEDVQHGLIDQMSFAFRAIEDDWDSEAKVPERRLLEVALEDISYVAFPAYPQTTADARVALRSFAESLGLAVEELAELATTVTTPEPGRPPEQAPDTTREPEPPEPHAIRPIIVKGLNA